MAQDRLQKILARAGVSSRRAAESLITSGRVRVNGQAVVELGARADPERDRIEVDGRSIAREHHVYYLLHKPRGMVTTLNDPEGRPSLGELLRDVSERVYPVGRLDFHTSGALLLTNDGDLAQALLHPSRAVPKTYVAKLSREVDDYMLRALESGVVLDDGYRTQPARVEHLRDEEGKSWLEITITEGKNRQIHRMVETLDTRVMRLSRLSFAGLSTEGLRPGALRPLSRDEVAMLQREYLPAAGTERWRAGLQRDASAHPGDASARPRDAQGARKRRVSERATGERVTKQPPPTPAPSERGRQPKHGASQPAEGTRSARRGGGTQRREGQRAERSVRADERASTPRATARGAQSEARKAAARVDSPRSARHKNRPT